MFYYLQHNAAQFFQGSAKVLLILTLLVMEEVRLKSMFQRELFG